MEAQPGGNTPPRAYQGCPAPGCVFAEAQAPPRALGSMQSPAQSAWQDMLSALPGPAAHTWERYTDL